MSPRLNAVLHALLLIVPLCAFGQAVKDKGAHGHATDVMCGLQTYHDGLSLAFERAAAGDGEALVTVQVLPSFQREYAVIVKRTASGLMLLRATFRNQLWTQLGPPLHVPKTRQQCLEIAQAAEMETVTVPASTEQANSLWTTFTGTRLDSDTCTRRKGKCVYFEDGTGYVIQTADGRSIRLTEVSGAKDVISENTALLDWVHSILHVAKNTQNSPQSQ